MEINFLSLLFSGVAIMALLVGVFLLVRFNWLKGWILGSMGLGLLGIALVCSVIVLSFNNYQTISGEEPIATINFTKIGPKHFTAELSEARGEKFTFELHGDLWNVSAEVVSWADILKKQGLQPYYRLSSVEASYALLNNANRLPRSKYQVGSKAVGIDLYTAAESGFIPFINAKAGASGEIPMSDGALFSIRLTHAGLVTIPENKVAFAVTQ